MMPFKVRSMTLSYVVPGSGKGWESFPVILPKPRDNEKVGDYAERQVAYLRLALKLPEMACIILTAVGDHVGKPDRSCGI
jgi:hypothetical protein